MTLKAAPEMVVYFANLIEKETGIHYSATNSHMLENRIRDLMGLLSFSSMDDFWKDVQTKGLSPMARTMVLDLATNNETSFFRDIEVFEFFRDEFLAKYHTSGTIDIWCAASSTGQEPYSLSMILNELKSAGINRTYNILATDLSDRVLKKAQEGKYTQLEIQRGLPTQLLIKYFEQEPSQSTLPQYLVKPELKRGLNFRQLNLLDDWPSKIGPFDIVFCRNVLIYQKVEQKKIIISNIKRVLKPKGFLVLGGAESIVGLSDDFEFMQFGKACVYRAKG